MYNTQIHYINLLLEKVRLIMEIKNLQAYSFHNYWKKKK